MNVISFPQYKVESRNELNEEPQGVQLMLALWHDAIGNLEYTLSRLGEVRNEVINAAAYQLIENALAELKSIDPEDLSSEECRTVLCERLKNCNYVLVQSSQLIRSRSLT